MKKYKPLWVKPDTHKKVGIKARENLVTHDGMINILLKNEISTPIRVSERSSAKKSK